MSLFGNRMNFKTGRPLVEEELSVHM